LQAYYRHPHHQQRHQNNPVRSVPINQNSTQPFTVEENRISTSVGNNTQPHFPTTALIRYYPHRLRTRQQYFRENEPPKELDKNKDKLYLAANIYYQFKHYEEESRKWKIYEQVASRKEQIDISMTEIDEIPIARPFIERHSKILNLTLSDSDSNSNSNKDKGRASSASGENSSDSEEEDKKKRKLQDTSISPKDKDKDKETRVSLRKSKGKSRKKNKVPIENDPRAPEGSPILVRNEIEDRAVVVQTARPDTPASPNAKRRRLFTHEFRPPRDTRTKRIALQPEEPTPALPRTPPGIAGPPILSPRQSIPRTTVSRQAPITSSPMEQDKVVESVPFSLDSFEFPIIPIECKFHFKFFRVEATASTIKDHREFLEKKARQQRIAFERTIRQLDEQAREIARQYIESSIEPLIDSLVKSNQKRLDNLVLDQMREKAMRTIENKATRENKVSIEKAQSRFERGLQLKFQLDKLDKRLNENMPPPALNIIDRLQFRSKELDSEIKEQHSEQWNSIIRKTKLELTTVMRTAKVAEIDKADREHKELADKIPIGLRQAYKDLTHIIQVRQERVAKKKLDFLERRVQKTSVR
jgi:hypothetical protein